VQLSVSTRHGHLSEATQAKLTEKAEKLARFFDRLTAIEITVDLKDPQKPAVDVNVSAEHKHDFVAHEQADNLFAALDACVQKIEQQLRKYKERVQDKHRNPEVRRPAEVAPLAGEDEEETEAEG
jgi:putative sigma-54 modulation protein